MFLATFLPLTYNPPWFYVYYFITYLKNNSMIPYKLDVYVYIEALFLSRENEIFD